jgi:hypothetical protein
MTIVSLAIQIDRQYFTNYTNKDVIQFSIGNYLFKTTNLFIFPPGNF